jgi:hypothetical protein
VTVKLTSRRKRTMNGPESLQAMSKKLEKRATRLVRKAEGRAMAIRRVVRQYHDAIQKSATDDPASPTERHREIERAVVKYNEVHKALKRLRKSRSGRSNPSARNESEERRRSKRTSTICFPRTRRVFSSSGISMTRATIRWSASPTPMAQSSGSLMMMKVNWCSLESAQPVIRRRGAGQ